MARSPEEGLPEEAQKQAKGVEAIKENGGKNVRPQGILKFITLQYGLEANRANLLAKKAIKI